MHVLSRGRTPDDVSRIKRLAPQVIVGTVVSVAALALLIANVGATSASAQPAPEIVPNISTEATYAGPDVVLSGRAEVVFDEIASVTVTVQNATTLQYVQADGSFGPNPAALESFTALLPPPTMEAVSPPNAVAWRVPLQLVDGNYLATITAAATGSTTTAAPIPFTVGPPSGPTSTELIAPNATWRYYDLGETPAEQLGTPWYGTAYDDSAWLAGPAQLGFGGADTTTIASVDALGNPVLAAYFRHDFTVSDPAALGDEITLTLLADDGAVIYVNGQEWARPNMKDVGPISYQTLAKTDSDQPLVTTFDPSLLVPGQNNISVEVHQYQPATLDLSFSLSVIEARAATESLESDARPGTYVLAAGDMANCGSTVYAQGDEKVADAIDELFDTDAGVFLGLGDLAYQSGTIEEFFSCYGPTIGRFKGVTWPSPGNHEHDTPVNAAGYREYFGEAAGPNAAYDPNLGLWYSFDIDEYWHVISLDSDCASFEPLPGAIDGDGCAVGSAQEQWLRADLAANADKNILAFFHHPPYANNSKTDHEYTWPLLRALNEYGADITLHGHEHMYERYAPINIWGEVDELHGARQFTIGSGGTVPRPLARPPDPRSEYRGIFIGSDGNPDDFDYAVLELWLQPDGYEWRWKPLKPENQFMTDEGVSGLAEPLSKGVFSGVMTSSDGSTPIVGMDVCMVKGESTCIQTDSTGAFAFEPNFVGSYAVTFVDTTGGHVSQVRGINLVDSGVTLDVEMQRVRAMSGLITSEDTNQPLFGATVCVAPEPVTGDSCITVGASGQWQIGGLLPGDYQLKFTKPGYQTECFADNEGCVSPTSITLLAAGDLFGINTAMQRQDGDVNCDGSLNILDAFVMAQHAVGLRTDNGPCPLANPATMLYAGNGDTNFDGQHNIVDAYGLASCAVGLSGQFCP